MSETKMKADLGEAHVERVDFPNNCPCRLRGWKSSVNEIGLPHYAPTVEIILTEGVKGSVFIGQEKFVAEENDVFFIAPNVVHYSRFLAGEGDIHVFKISMELISEYLDIERLLGAAGKTMADLPGHPTRAFDALRRIIFDKISYGDNRFATVKGVIGIFELLCSLSNEDEHNENKAINDRIFEIIKWTQERVCERITVEDAAAELHYSKYHFCRLFKEHVGISYLKYINTLKIDHAAKLLREGHSSTYCCFECGFDSLSYFLKLFKDITGYTTSEYKRIMKIE